MEYLIIALKLIVGLSILNVWLLRAKKPTEWRGGNAANITEEFEAYGLPKWFMYLVGVVKSVLAVLLIASIHFSSLEYGAAVGIAILMAGAVIMHFKIGDPAVKSLPAGAFLVSAVIIAFL